MFNKKGVRFIHERTRPLAVDSMDAAAEAILKQLERGPAPSTEPLAWARNLAWVIGFDTLIDERKAIHHIMEKIAK